MSDEYLLHPERLVDKCVKLKQKELRNGVMVIDWCEGQVLSVEGMQSNTVIQAIGHVDGTNFPIIAQHINDCAFINRCGFHSLNVMVQFCSLSYSKNTKKKAGGCALTFKGMR